MSDLRELRRSAARQASTGNYWAGKCVGLIDRLQAWEAGFEELASIVRDLADSDPRRRLTPDSEEDCAVCGDPMYDHTDPACPVLRARTFVAGPVDTVEDE